MRVVVLLSGSGRSLENLVEKIAADSIPVEITGVVSSHREAYGLARAERLGLAHKTIDFRKLKGSVKGSVDGFSSAVTSAIDVFGADLVLLAGFLRRWIFPERYSGRVLNIHPALLPAFGGPGFYGERVHRAVIEAGEKFSGCTVHFCDHEYDTGPIVLQRVVPVLESDTPQSLAARVFAEECIAYPEAVRLVAEGRLRIENSRVLIDA